MAMKLGNVYLYNKTYLYFKDKRRVKKRIVYTVQEVSSAGELSEPFEKMFRRNDCKLVDKCEINIQVILSKYDKDKNKFYQLVKRAVVYNDTSKAYRVNQRKSYHDNIAKLAICCSGYFNKAEDRRYNLRDFSEAMNLTRNSDLYKWVRDFYNFYFTTKKYKQAIPSASDTTIISVIRKYNETLSSYIGYSKKLDELIHNDLKAYIKEFQKRGLRL